MKKVLLFAFAVIILYSSVTAFLRSWKDATSQSYGDSPEIKESQPTAASSGLDIDKIIYGGQSEKQGHDAAQVKTDKSYAVDEEATEDTTAKVVNQFRQAAEQDDASAQLILGCIYCGAGRQPETNFAKGKKWLQKAAAHQDEDSQNIAAIAKDIIKELEDIEAAIAEAEACKQLMQSKNKDKGTENKDGKGIASLDNYIAELNLDLHISSDLIIGVHNQNKEAIEELNRRRQSRELFHRTIKTIFTKYQHS